jgi:hypothetical protein
MDEPNNWQHCKRALLRTKLRIKDAEAKLVLAKMLLARLRRELRLHNSKVAA